jgi:hypothetical protein
MSKFHGTYYEDRTGQQISVGQIVRIQHCIGRYGQTEIVEGQIESISPYGGVTLRQAIRDGVSLGTIYVTVTRTGHEKFDDFEHGHEKWTQIIRDPTVPRSEPPAR